MPRPLSSVVTSMIEDQDGALSASARRRLLLRRASAQLFLQLSRPLLQSLQALRLVSKLFCRRIGRRWFFEPADGARGDVERLVVAQPVKPFAVFELRNLILQ